VTTAPLSRGPGPLDGLLVLDFSRVLSGPHCARMLTDLGATVVKIEPPEGDMTRFAVPRVNSIASYFAQQNVGKRNISVDLRRPEAVALLRRLAKKADVVLENFRPGVMARMGLSYADLAADNPRLVYAAISGYGQTGPWNGRRAYAPVVGAESGFTYGQGMGRGGQFANDVYSHADVYTSLECCSAILAALYQREQTGLGQSIDVSMCETMLYVNEHLHWELSTTHDDLDDEVPSFAPSDYPVLPTAEGHTVVVSGHPAARGTFELYIAAMGRPELATDPRFATVHARRAHLAELVDEMRAWAMTFTDLDKIEGVLADNGLAMGVLRSSAEVAATEWAQSRDAIAEISDRGDGTFRVPNSPWKFSAAATGVRGVPAYRGEHNREVLHDLLDLSDGEIDALETAGVLTSRVPKRT
jgi:CoA:oxalate CoA-transferase